MPRHDVCPTPSSESSASPAGENCASTRAMRRLIFGGLLLATPVVAWMLAPSPDRARAQGTATAAQQGEAGKGAAAPKAPAGGSSPPASVAPGAKSKGGPPPMPAVTVSQPLVRDIVEWDEYTGRFEAVASVEIRARVAGYLDRIAFTDGQVVKKGDLLFEIDPRPFERVLAQARAELDQARTKASNASMDVERGRPLVERKIMSEKVFDDRSSLLREAEAAVKVAEAKVATAELDASFTRVTAPIDGRISRASVSPGSWISAGASANPTVLTLIVTQDPIHIYFDVNENNFLKYKRLAERGEVTDARMADVAIEIALPDESTFRHKGRLDFLDNRLDPGTATMRARAIVANPNALFSPGMFARVRLAGTPKRPTLMLPDSAILTDQASKYVLVVDDAGVVGKRTVRLGPINEAMRIVREGVTGADWVITNGLQRARPGMKVAPKREPLKITTTSDRAPASGMIR